MRLITIVLLLVLAACGGDIQKGPKGGNNSANNGPGNNGSENNGTCTENDADCEDATCGDGVVSGGETCDGDCPTSCAPMDACDIPTLSGTPDQCNVECTFDSVSTCQGGDGCCPSLCTSDNDSDCREGCGNGVLEPGELCDGDCPTACQDDDACTLDIYSGSVSTCTAMCTQEQITQCQSGDGCCPSGCTDATDADCGCTPTTCQAEGAECGAIPNGCGAMITCPNTCNAGETCSGNQCVASGNGEIGSPCGSVGDCAAIPDATCIQHNDYKDGYCSANCQFDNDCPRGSHCARLVIGDPAKEKVCMKNCASDVDCRADGYACFNWDDYDDMATVSDECAPAATGTGEIGDPCTGVYQCSPDLYCAQEANDNANGTTTLPGGACTTSCIPVLVGCGAGYVCTDAGICMPECFVPNQCRTGYTCVMGNFEQRTHCWPQ